MNFKRIIDGHSHTVYYQNSKTLFITTACQASTYGSSCKGMCHCSPGSSCDRFEGRCTDGDVCDAGWTDYPTCQTGGKYVYFIIIVQLCKNTHIMFDSFPAWLQSVI